MSVHSFRKRAAIKKFYVIYRYYIEALKKILFIRKICCYAVIATKDLSIPLLQSMKWVTLTKAEMEVIALVGNSGQLR